MGTPTSYSCLQLWGPYSQGSWCLGREWDVLLGGVEHRRHYSPAVLLGSGTGQV